MGQITLADRLKRVLQGDPLRAITYGGAAVAWLAAQIGFAAGITQVEPPSFEAVSIAVIGAIATLTELARRYVYSPVTVDRIVEAAIDLGRKPAESPKDVPPDPNAGDTTPVESPRFPA